MIRINIINRFEINFTDVFYLSKIQQGKTEFMGIKAHKIHVRSSKDVVNLDELLAWKAVGKISGSAATVNFLPHTSH